jgi:hypothetical protein
MLQLQMRQLSVSWTVYARWTAIILLAGLLVVTAMRLRLRRRSEVQTASGPIGEMRDWTVKRSGKNNVQGLGAGDP